MDTSIVSYIATRVSSLAFFHPVMYFHVMLRYEDASVYYVCFIKMRVFIMCVYHVGTPEISDAYLKTVESSNDPDCGTLKL